MELIGSWKMGGQCQPPEYCTLYCVTWCCMARESRQTLAPTPHAPQLQHMPQHCYPAGRQHCSGVWSLIWPRTGGQTPEVVLMVRLGSQLKWCCSGQENGRCAGSAGRMGPDHAPLAQLKLYRCSHNPLLPRAPHALVYPARVVPYSWQHRPECCWSHQHHMCDSTKNLHPPWKSSHLWTLELDSDHQGHHWRFECQGLVQCQAAGQDQQW